MVGRESPKLLLTESRLDSINSEFCPARPHLVVSVNISSSVEEILHVIFITRFREPTVADSNYIMSFGVKECAT